MNGFILFIPLVIFSLDSAWKFSGSTTEQLEGEIINRVETRDKVVALTFDDGPTPGYAQRILDVLEQEGVRATFFLVGNAIEAWPEGARRIVEAGHEVGNHSYSHSRMILRDYDFVASELERTEALIRAAGYTQPIHFRPPYGRKLFSLPRYLAERGMPSITWDVAPETYGQDPQESQDIIDGVLDSVRPGSIVLLHVMFENRENTLAAVPDIIHGLRGKGYRFVTVSELLGYRDPG